jgi:hypothetical protein
MVNAGPGSVGQWYRCLALLIVVQGKDLLVLAMSPIISSSAGNGVKQQIKLWWTTVHPGGHGLFLSHQIVL